MEFRHALGKFRSLHVVGIGPKACIAPAHVGRSGTETVPQTAKQSKMDIRDTNQSQGCAQLLRVEMWVAAGTGHLSHIDQCDNAVALEHIDELRLGARRMPDRIDPGSGPKHLGIAVSGSQTIARCRHDVSGHRRRHPPHLLYWRGDPSRDLDVHSWSFLLRPTHPMSHDHVLQDLTCALADCRNLGVAVTARDGGSDVRSSCVRSAEPLLLRARLCPLPGRGSAILTN